MRRTSTQVALLCLMAGGCLRAEIGDGEGPAGDGPDAGARIDSPDAAPELGAPDATPPPPDAGPVAAVLTHSQSNEIVPGNSAACRDDVSHADNSYYRVFALADFGIATDFTVDTVGLAIQSATSGTGTQPVVVKLHALAGPFVVANLTELAETTIAVADQDATLLDVPIVATAPAGSTLVVEVFTPDGSADGNLFRIGSNGGGQTGPSYLRAPAEGCDLLEPTDLATIGFPDMHIVLSASGTHY